jgi:hypothetical protein
MAIPSMPAIDVNTCGDWTENQIELYEKMPYYLGKFQADIKRTFPTFSKIINKKRKWKANSGNTLRVIKTNPSPHLRQQVRPKPIVSGAPLTDVMNVTESKAEAAVYSHQFESPHFSFLPSFTDFMDHIDDHGKDIMEKIERFNELFLRTMIFHMAPKAFVCKEDGTVELVNTPYFDGTGQLLTTDGKTEAYLAALAPSITGHLTMTSIEMAMTIAENDLRIPFFSGSDLPKDDQPLDGMFLQTLSSEAYNQFIHDPWVRDNKSIDMNYVNNNYRGRILGRATTRIEDMPLRFKADGSMPEPELRVSDEDVYNHGETEPNPQYANPTNSPYEIGFLCGKNNYEAIDVGPVPSQFASNKFPNAPAMEWNGQPRLTKNFLIKCLEADGETVAWQANTYGKFIKFINESTFGIVPGNRKNIIPVFYRRKRGK